MCIIPCRSNQNRLSLSSMIIYLKALWKLTYHQALFDSLERHTGKPFKSQLSVLLFLDRVLTPHCFQDTQLTGCPEDGMHTALEAQQAQVSGWEHRANSRTAVAGLPSEPAPSRDSCQESPAMLEPLYSCQVPTPVPAVQVPARSGHPAPRAAQGQTQQMTEVARARHKLGQVYFGGSLFVPLLFPPHSTTTKIAPSFCALGAVFVDPLWRQTGSAADSARPSSLLRCHL